MAAAKSVPEEEFKKWLTPRSAEAQLKGLGGWNGTRRAILERLSSGLIDAAAAKYHGSDSGSDKESYSDRWRIPTSAWKHHAPRTDSDFWGSGQFSFIDDAYYNREITRRFFGVRFDPSGIAQLRTDAGLGDDQPAIEDATPQSPAADERPPLSKAEAERFCRAVLSGWGNEVTQDWAYAKAVLFFPDKKIARDTFRSILRSIRGPMSPGKRGKTDK